MNYKVSLETKFNELKIWTIQNRSNIELVDIYRKVTNSKGHKRVFISFYYKILPNKIFESRIDRFLKKTEYIKNEKGGISIFTNKIKTQDEFKRDLEQKRPKLFEVLSEYTGNKNKILVKNLKCGHSFETIPIDILNKGITCPICATNKKLTTDEFKKEVYDLYKNDYEVLGEYESRHTKIKLKHLKCDNIFYMSPNCFVKRNQQCPFCKNSKLENKIKSFLLKYNIKFEKEKTFDTCKHINRLRFDFYLPEYNLLIEADGEGHYIPIWDGLKGYLNQKRRDFIKNKWVRENNINLLRIPYFDFKNINKLLYYKLIYKR